MNADITDSRICICIYIFTLDFNKCLHYCSYFDFSFKNSEKTRQMLTISSYILLSKLTSDYKRIRLKSQEFNLMIG
jgi:hypothetical protein